FSFFFAAAAGKYGISSPSTTPSPGGIAPAAPSAANGPGPAAWSWMSQFAELTACQMPFKSGLPSAVRDALYVGSSLAAGLTASEAATTTTAPTIDDLIRAST